MNFEKEVEATQSSGNIANAVLATVLSPFKEKDRNKIFLRLLQKLLNDKDYEAIGLLRTMIENDTLAMQKSYEIMTEYLENTKPSNSTKPVLNDGFIIDFFELMFLAESVIPPRPIARSMCFDDFSERHYHKMNDNQRKQFFEHVQKCNGFSLENEQCRHFFARFNPKNQYLVSCFYNGKAEEIICYRFDEEYRIEKNRFVNREYIKKVVRLHDSQTII